MAGIPNQGRLEGTGPRVRRLNHEAFEVVGVGETSPVFARRADAERWMRAALAKLPARNRPQARSCMCCGASFASAGAYNRLCDICRQSDPGPVAMAWSRPRRRGEGAGA